MPGIVTRHFRLHNAIQFLESFSESAPTQYYYYIGRNIPYANTVQLTGTVKFTNGSNTFVGQGTYFTTELNVGDNVYLTGQASTFRVHSIPTAQTFVSVSQPSSSNTTGANVYIRKSFSEASPPTPVDSYQNTYFDVWRNIISLKRIQASDVSHVVQRIDWANNHLYTQYDDVDSNMASKEFYVMTNDYNIYKCIENARGANSVVKPTGTSTSIISTADGYRWKYLFTVSSADRLKFMNDYWIPVKTLTANNGSAQWEVQQNVSNGAIHHIEVIANGSGYLYSTGSFQSVSNSTVVKLSSSANTANGIYTGSGLFIRSGLGAGQVRKILSYVGANNTVTVNGAFTTLPNTSSQYLISPLVTVFGDSGLIANNKATAYVSNTYGGQVREITMVNLGKNYSIANVSITANAGFGATAKPIISPLYGHGADAVDELFADNIMIDLRVAGSESNTFPTNNDFRMIGLLRDPLLANGSVANSPVIDQTTRINVNDVTGDFTADEVITGLSSGTKARLVYFANSNATRTAGVLKVSSIVTNGLGEKFRAGETVQGASSTITANVVSITPPALKPYSGLVIYNENRVVVDRAPDQTEDVKIVISF